ncbi:hypothetical protein PS1_043008 [Malus domestica]
MQGISRAVRSCREILKSAILQHSRGGEVAGLEKIVSRLKWVTSPPAQEKGLENVTVADVLATKGNVETGPWLWCHTNDAVIDAVKNMAKQNIGSLLVLKPGEHQHIAGIITERDYLRKVIAQERSPIYTRVGEIMTNENQLITVTSDMNVLQAMQLMTGTPWHDFCSLTTIDIEVNNHSVVHKRVEADKPNIQFKLPEYKPCAADI